MSGQREGRLGPADAQKGHFRGSRVKMEDARLTVKDNGPDETNYTLTGTAVISPASFEYASTVYTLSDPASVSYSKKYGFKVLKTSPPKVRWGFAEDWTYLSGAAPMGVVVNFQTMSGANCMTSADVDRKSVV